jgi:hypothetical protein
MEEENLVETIEEDSERMLTKEELISLRDEFKAALKVIEDAITIWDVDEEELNSINKEDSKWKISNLFKNFQKL